METSDLYVGGAWHPAADGATRDIVCPADGRLVTTVSEAGPEDTRDAVAAARAAFDSGPWPRTGSLERGALLHRVADLLVRDTETYARAESADTGKRLVESRYDLADVIAVFRYFAGLASAEAGRVVDVGRADVVSRVVHEPIGVCALITPWNYPLLQTSWKVAPALAAGCTFVLKPSELTPSTAILLLQTLTPEKVACDYASTPLQKVVSTEFVDSGSPAYQVVHKFTWTNDDQNVVAKYIAQDKMAPEAAADKWIAASPNKVAAWLPA